MSPSRADMIAWCEQQARWVSGQPPTREDARQALGSMSGEQIMEWMESELIADAAMLRAIAAELRGKEDA